VIDCTPLVGFVPVQADRPEALQLDASVLDQVSVIAPPLRREAGLDVIEIVGGLVTGGSLTVTVVLSETVPPSPTQVMV